MLCLLNNTNFFSQYGLLIVLVVALVALMFISFTRRKKEDAYRNDLLSKIVPGAKIKTYYGLYGKVLKITETTDGKILLVETGEDDKVSYQSVHINAVYALDEKQLDTETEEVAVESKSEAELKFEELERQLAEKEAESEKEEVKEEAKEEVKEEVEELKEEKTEKPAKKTTSKKSSK